MHRIIYTRPGGGVSVLSPAEGARLAWYIAFEDGSTVTAGAGDNPTRQPQPVDSLVRGWPIEGAMANWAETEDEFVARILAKDVPPDAANVTVINESAIPGDRTFRNAWVHCPVNGCKVDLDKAREIHRDRLRMLRAPKLAALDIAYQRADEKGDGPAKAAIATQKQALRDVTTDPAIAAAQTPEELAAVMPRALV